MIIDNYKINRSKCAWNAVIGCAKHVPKLPKAKKLQNTVFRIVFGL